MQLIQNKVTHCRKKKLNMISSNYKTILG